MLCSLAVESILLHQNGKSNSKPNKKYKTTGTETNRLFNNCANHPNVKSSIKTKKTTLREGNAALRGNGLRSRSREEQSGRISNCPQGQYIEIAAGNPRQLYQTERAALHISTSPTECPFHRFAVPLPRRGGKNEGAFRRAASFPSFSREQSARISNCPQGQYIEIAAGNPRQLYRTERNALRISSRRRSAPSTASRSPSPVGEARTKERSGGRQFLRSIPSLSPIY